MERQGFFKTTYLIAILAVIAGMFFSRALLSIGEITLAATWLLEGNLGGKIKRFMQDRNAVLLVGVYIMHLVGLLYTSDFNYAVKDLRIKLPLLLFPVVFSTTSLLKKPGFKSVNHFYILTVLVASIVIAVNYTLNSSTINDMREASFFISHIRLALMICLAMGLSLYYLFAESGKFKYILIGVNCWFIFFMLFFEMITGIVIVMLIFPFLSFWLSKITDRHDRVLRIISYSAISAFVILICYTSYLIYSTVHRNEPKEVRDMDRSPNGNQYFQLYNWNKNYMRENGYLVYQNICYPEVQSVWNKRARIKVNFHDRRSTKAEQVLVRYISSLGLAKDSAGVSALTDRDIRAIESGITNADDLNRTGYHIRISNIIWELNNYFSGGNFNGHSLAMRLEYWKTGWHIIKNNALFGVGTGDTESSFQQQYEMDKTRLSKTWRFRAHNQFISMTVAFGFLGLVIFCASLALPILRCRKRFIYVTFALIILLSMLTEDTIDTQIGVSFYSFFNSLFIFQDED